MTSNLTSSLPRQPGHNRPTCSNLLFMPLDAPNVGPSLGAAFLTTPAAGATSYFPAAVACSQGSLGSSGGIGAWGGSGSSACGSASLTTGSDSSLTPANGSLVDFGSLAVHPSGFGQPLRRYMAGYSTSGHLLPLNHAAASASTTTPFLVSGGTLAASGHLSASSYSTAGSTLLTSASATAGSSGQHCAKSNSLDRLATAVGGLTNWASSGSLGLLCGPGSTLSTAGDVASAGGSAVGLGPSSRLRSLCNDEVTGGAESSSNRPGHEIGSTGGTGGEIFGTGGGISGAVGGSGSQGDTANNQAAAGLLASVYATPYTSVINTLYVYPKQLDLNVKHNFTRIHVGEEIRSSIPPEDDGGFLLTSCRLALLEDSCISEVIFFDSGEKVLSFRPSYDEHHRRRRIPLDQLSIGFTGRFMLTLFPSNGEFLLTSCRLALLEDSC
ncbi:unnamed protein product [Protopolystoma xenopodis]|uniref:Uncharacterized protein n=1 Tax=Protopolystoma xenopodis TaxID=117903 RepID=A0A448XPA2_9PLAT|nr:unnamed protein product [Protopolystoma xenopodis]